MNATAIAAYQLGQPMFGATVDRFDVNTEAAVLPAELLRLL